jgi:hypothetical protein
VPRARAVLVFVALAAVFGGSPSPATAGTHPHFNDRGTLDWYRTLPEAQAAARSSGKLIFIESGRLECGSCRKLVERTLPQEPIRSRLAAIAVGVADDCDVQGSEAARLLNRGLPGATFLPLVGFVTPDGRWITGWFGGATPQQVLGHLELAEQAHARLAAQGPAPAASPVAPPAARAPAPPPAPARVAPAPAPSPIRTAPAPVPAPTRVAAPPSPAPMRTAPTPAPLARTAPAPRVAPSPVAPPAPAPKAAPVPPPAIAQAPRANPVGASGSATGNDVRSRARAASETGDWGTDLRLWEEAGDGRDAGLLADLSPYAERAHLWCLRQVDDAERAAQARRYEDARRSLELVRRCCEGTSCPIAVDAERGERAVERLMAIEQGSPDQADAPEMLRRRSYQEFRGSRWAPLFRSRS